MKRDLEDKDLKDVSGGGEYEICNPCPGGTPCEPGEPIGGSPGVHKDPNDPGMGGDTPDDFNKD
jgi:hypothetical protein